GPRHPQQAHHPGGGGLLGLCPQPPAALVYERRTEPEWTAAFQDTGLHGLLTAVAREIHRGTLRTRADSKLTRALRKALHTMGLENFQAMGEEEGVKNLVQLAEEGLG
ncbi:MAG: hypothetical protein IKU62_00775, partial [Ruminiclostridium sp.]|nr:hypothetical protein [Ruminiclostridium sp.]